MGDSTKKMNLYECCFLNNRFKNVIDVKIPFPSFGHQKNFNTKFIEALKLADYYIINEM